MTRGVETVDGQVGMPSDALRLLIVGNASSIHVARWATFFGQRGHVVTVATLGRRPTRSDGGGDGRPYRVEYLGDPRIAWLRLIAAARRLRAQIVHGHYLTHYGWLTWATMRRPYAITIWGSDVLIDPWRSRVARAWARLVLGAAAIVTGDSDEVLGVARRLGARPAATKLIQFGVDVARFRPGPAPAALAAELGTDGRHVVFAPRAITSLYSTTVIVEALSAVPGAVLVMSLAGADPTYTSLVRATADRLGVGDRVRIVPPIDHRDIDRYYRLADVVVSVPTSDGTPVSVLEALATGIPVVATDLPSVRPWIARLDEALLVPVGDPDATARAILRTLEPSMFDRADFRDRARRLIVAEGDQTTNMLRMEGLYAELVKS